MLDRTALSNEEELVLRSALLMHSEEERRREVQRAFPSDANLQDKLFQFLARESNVDLTPQIRDLQTQLLSTQKALESRDSPIRLGKYEIERLVASGGTGTLFKAIDSENGQIVALKMLRLDLAANATVQIRFLEEARLASHLAHPHILKQYDAAFEGALPYFVSQWCEDGDLATWIDRNNRAESPESACRFVAKICEGIEYCHNLNIAHLDLKPANILLCQTPKSPPTAIDSLTQELSILRLDNFDPLIADFGISKVIDTALKSSRSTTFAGTFVYMAPEQLTRKFGPVGKSSDIYAIGLILCELLGFAPPRANSNLRNTNAFLSADTSFDAAWLKESISPELRKVIQRCLAIDPKQRYSSVSDLRIELMRFVDGQKVRATEISPVEKIHSWIGQPERIQEVANLSRSISLIMTIWMISGIILLLMPSFPKQHFVSTLVPLVVIQFGYLLPIFFLMYLGYRRKTWAFVAAFVLTFIFSVLTPLLVLFGQIQLIGAYENVDYFEKSNHVLVATSGIIQLVAYSIALYASRRQYEFDQVQD